ncbi:hypothetical protein ABIC83_006124 [Roseateles asaccharophilus]|uniref:Uncharacterized protein n=1 Tax=Roseateles asaccharophilus TaxID=582607 RepID=A0ABU2AG00_9BURK|nr:hypothetical protein [Roseateles asaccharophilus]
MRCLGITTMPALAALTNAYAHANTSPVILPAQDGKP